jgi:DUF917 family protein
MNTLHTLHPHLPALKFSRTLAAGALASVLMLGVSTAHADDEALPADQVISAIRAAVAAHPGRVKDVEIDTEDGVVIVEVDIVGTDGKEHEVKINPSNNSVIR